MQGVSPDEDDSNVLLRHHPLQLRVLTLSKKMGVNASYSEEIGWSRPCGGQGRSQTVPTRPRGTLKLPGVFIPSQSRRPSRLVPYASFVIAQKDRLSFGHRRDHDRLLLQQQVAK
jgi:hypothetical protein